MISGKVDLLLTPPPGRLSRQRPLGQRLNHTVPLPSKSKHVDKQVPRLAVKEDREAVHARPAYKARLLVQEAVKERSRPLWVGEVSG
jgi:hypothetical protein